MKFSSEQLTGHLKKTLAPVYLISGDEIVTVQEGMQAIRYKAHSQGFSERRQFMYERGFDWEQVFFEAKSMSLFAEKKLIEIRLNTTKIGDSGSKAIQKICLSMLDQDLVFVIICDKLDSSGQRSKWVKAIESAGVWVQVWPIDAARFPQWIGQKAQHKGLEISVQGIQMIVERVEGNPLAAVQELEKLWLANGAGRVSDEWVQNSITDSSRFNVYTLVDYCLAGHSARVVHVLNGLFAEGVDPVLVLWALVRDIRVLADLSAAATQGENVEMLFNKYRIWERRKPLIRTALQRHTQKTWFIMLKNCGKIDLAIKGFSTENTKDQLLALCMMLSKKELFSDTKQFARHEGA